MGRKGAAEHNIRFEDTVDELYALTQSALREVRTLSYVLHPPFDERGGLSGTIEWLVQGFERRSELKVTYERPESPARLSEAMEVALFRVLQESLSNVVRHARATRVTVRFLQDVEGISLEIEDDGRGGIDDRGPSVGVGLASMRERMYEVGGTLDIQSTARGTIVRATVPTTRKQ